MCTLPIPTTIKLDAASSTYASQNGIHTAVSFSQVTRYISWFIQYVLSSLNAHVSFWLVGYKGRSPYNGKSNLAEEIQFLLFLLIQLCGW